MNPSSTPANSNVTLAPTDEKLVFPYGKFDAEHLTMMSVHFRPCPPVRFHHSHRKEFFIPAAKPGTHHLLKIFDSQQFIPDTSESDRPYGEVLTPKYVPVGAIAQNLMQVWTEGFIGVMGRFKPGIMVLKGDKPTLEELAHCQRLETDLCRALIDEGWRIHRGDKSARGLSINDNHRGALDYMESERAPWYEPIVKGRMKVSVVTGNRINVEALVDGGVDLLEFYVKYDLDPLGYEDTHCAEMLKNPLLKEKILSRLGMSGRKKD